MLRDLQRSRASRGQDIDGLEPDPETYILKLKPEP